MAYWEHVLTLAFGVTLFVAGASGSGSLAVPILFGGSALAAWGLFGGIETAVERGRGPAGDPDEE